MIVGGKSNDGTMKEVRIFSKGNKNAQTSIHANSGKLNTLEDAFLLTLYDGEIHELGQKDYTNYRRIIFDKHVINIPAKDLLLNRRDSTNRSDREMTVPMIQKKINSYEKRLDIVYKRLSGNFFRTIGDSTLPLTLLEGKEIIDKAMQRVKDQDSLSVAQRIKKEKRIKNLERQLNNEFNLIKSYKKSQNKYGVEIHKKFSIPVACILFVLLGAPLGVMSKKGGFAISTGLSFGFFLIYYVLLISGEEMADRSFLSPAIGMWSPNLIILLISIYLLINTVRENAPIGIKLPSFFKKTKK
jgi:lipopolysaccharide export system permease protein